MVKVGGRDVHVSQARVSSCIPEIQVFPQEDLLPERGNKFEVLHRRESCKEMVLKVSNHIQVQCISRMCFIGGSSIGDLYFPAGRVGSVERESVWEGKEEVRTGRRGRSQSLAV